MISQEYQKKNSKMFTQIIQKNITRNNQYTVYYLINNPYIPNIHALNSDTNTLFLSILKLNPQCVGVAIESIDI